MLVVARKPRFLYLSMRKLPHFSVQTAHVHHMLLVRHSLLHGRSHSVRGLAKQPIRTHDQGPPAHFMLISANKEGIMAG